jgi:hypothetical protein
VSPLSVDWRVQAFSVLWCPHLQTYFFMLPVAIQLSWGRRRRKKEIGRLCTQYTIFSDYGPITFILLTRTRQILKCRLQGILEMEFPFAPRWTKLLLPTSKALFTTYCQLILLILLIFESKRNEINVSILQSLEKYVLHVRHM